jgi:cysteine desulfurase family protein
VKIYLNNAASAWPRAPGVAEAIVRTLETPPSHPGRSVSCCVDVITQCRESLARLLGGVSAERIVLTMNATHSLNIAILGMALQKSDMVVTSVTEHNSVLRPLHHLQSRNGIQIRKIRLDSHGSIDVAEYRSALADKPRLVVLNHVSNVTGRIQDVASLLALAKNAGAVTILDASQSLGHIPLRADELSADIIVFTGHKGLHGPAGTGGMYVSPGIELEQFYVGGTGVRSDLSMHPTEMPIRLEAGTPNVPGLSGLATALQWYESNGEALRETEHQQSILLRTGLRDTSGIRLYGDDGDDFSKHIGITSFRIDGWDVEETGFVLQESFDIICRTGLHCAPLIHEAIGSAPEGTVRFSVSGFTTREEIDTALAAVRNLAS